MTSNERSQQIGWGVFLIGLAILFLTDWFFPGIFLVVGIAMLATSSAQGKNPMSNIPALAVIGTGLLFSIGDVLSLMGNFDWLPLLLILGGGYLLFKDRANSGRSSASSSSTAESEVSKPKNDYL